MPPRLAQSESRVTPFSIFFAGDYVYYVCCKNRIRWWICHIVIKHPFTISTLKKISDSAFGHGKWINICFHRGRKTKCAVSVSKKDWIYHVSASFFIGAKVLQHFTIDLTIHIWKMIQFIFACCQLLVFLLFSLCRALMWLRRTTPSRIHFPLYVRGIQTMARWTRPTAMYIAHLGSSPKQQIINIKSVMTLGPGHQACSQCNCIECIWHIQNQTRIYAEIDKNLETRIGTRKFG